LLLSLINSISRSGGSQSWQPIKRPELGSLSAEAGTNIALLRTEMENFGCIDTKGRRLNDGEKLICELTLGIEQVV